MLSLSLKFSLQPLSETDKEKTISPIYLKAFGVCILIFLSQFNPSLCSSFFTSGEPWPKKMPK